MNNSFWTFIFLLLGLIPVVHGFEYKTLCLLDYAPTEEELEGEGREWEGGMGQPAMAWAAPHQGNPGYYGGGEMEGDEREGDEWGGMMHGRPGGGMMMGAGGPVGMMGPGGAGGMAGMGAGMGGEMDEYEVGPGEYYGPGGGQPGMHYGMGIFPTNGSVVSSWRGRGQGYMDADGEWEDARKRRKRRRRRRSLMMNMMMPTKRVKRQLMMGGLQGQGGMWRSSPHTPVHLKGTLTCGAQSSIHILNATLGYTITPYCQRAFSYSCKGTSSKATQVLNCQGVIGNCDVAITRHFLGRCGQRVNYALIAYECIPATRRVNICSSHDSDVTGGVVIASPSYPLVQASSGTNADDIVTCECTLRAPADSSIHMQYLRAKLPGQYGSCEGDLLLLETPEQSNDGRYNIVSEICGTNYTTRPQDIHDNILRLTFLGGSPVQHTHGGFIGKFTAISDDGADSLFHVSCVPPPGTDGTDNSGGSGNSEKMTGGDGNAGGDGSGFVKGDEEKKSPGVLSGVVASLASVILIMGSVGALLIYRSVKSRRRRREDRDRGASFSSSINNDGAAPPPTNTQRFFTRPGQIVKSAAAPQPPHSLPSTSAGYRPASPRAPPFDAPPPPSRSSSAPNGLQTTTIYSIAYDIEDDTSSEDGPELASLSSLPSTMTAPHSPVAPPRNAKTTTTRTSSEPDLPSSSQNDLAVSHGRRNRTAMNSPYDNATETKASESPRKEKATASNQRKENPTTSSNQRKEKPTTSSSNQRKEKPTTSSNQRKEKATTSSNQRKEKPTTSSNQRKEKPRSSSNPREEKARSSSNPREEKAKDSSNPRKGKGGKRTARRADDNEEETAAERHRYEEPVSRRPRKKSTDVTVEVDAHDDDDNDDDNKDVDRRDSDNDGSFIDEEGGNYINSHIQVEAWNYAMDHTDTEYSCIDEMYKMVTSGEGSDETDT